MINPNLLFFDNLRKAAVGGTNGGFLQKGVWKEEKRKEDYNKWCELPFAPLDDDSIAPAFEQPLTKSKTKIDDFVK